MTLGSQMLSQRDVDQPLLALGGDELSRGRSLSDCHVRLGALYRMGDGVEPSGAKAMAHFRMAHALGSPEAAFHLASCYFYGHGTEAVPDLGQLQLQSAAAREKAQRAQRKKDLRQCVQWLKRAAQGKNTAAMFMLFQVYASGLEGAVRRDGAKALQWLRDAAEQPEGDGDDTLPMLRLAELLLHGDPKGVVPVRRSHAEGVAVLQRAADVGSARALCLLAEMAYSGRDGPRDEARAAALFERAVALGTEHSLDAVHALSALWPQHAAKWSAKRDELQAAAARRQRSASADADSDQYDDFKLF